MAEQTTIGRVCFDVSMELIRDALALPDHAIITHIIQDMKNPGLFTFYLSSTEFPPVPEGAAALVVKPIVRADHSKRPATWLSIDFQMPL